MHYVYYNEDNIKRLFPVWGVFTGVIVFVLIYGIKILNPFYVDWLLVGGDLSQHYLGWEFFRRGAWTFPIGLTDQLAYPIETSVLFTDSIPILAVIFKLFRGFLPEYFQYFGLWGMLCFGLQGYFATKIFNVLNVEWFKTVIGNVFLITAPVMLYRMFMHTSLGGQWIILASVYLFLRHDDIYRNNMKSVLYWGLLGILVAGVHLYFFPMCFLFVLGYGIRSLVNDTKLRIRYSFPVFCYMAGMCFHVYVLGGFASGAASGADGFEAYTFNLNALINPRGFSRVLPDLGSVSGFQHEGFAYLGLGILCMLVVYAIITWGGVYCKETLRFGR